MVNFNEVLETNRMIEEANLDVRTITMGISLLDCAHSDYKIFQQKVYDKITHKAEKLVETGEEISARYGIPIVNKRISITPAAICASACEDPHFPELAEVLDRAARRLASILSAAFPRLCRRA